MAALLTAKPPAKARPLRIDPQGAQYKSSGAIQIGIMNESKVITVGVKEDFQCLRGAAHRMRTKLHYLMQKKVRPLHKGIVTIPQRASGFDRVGEFY